MCGALLRQNMSGKRLPLVTARTGAVPYLEKKGARLSGKHMILKTGSTTKKLVISVIQNKVMNNGNVFSQ